MSTLRWFTFGGLIVDDRERFYVDYDNIGPGGFTLTHDLGHGSSHSVGHMGQYQNMATLEEAAIAHATGPARAGHSCLNGD